MYEFTVFAGISFAATIINIALGIIILSKNPKGRLNQLYFILTLGMVVWCFSEGLQRMVVGDADVGPWHIAAIWGRISWAAVVFGSMMMIHLSYVLARLKKGIFSKIHFITILYLLGAFFVGIILFTENLFVSGATHTWWGYTSTREGNIGYILFLFVYLMMVIFVSYFMVNAIKGASSIIERSQLILALIGIFILVIPGGIGQLVLNYVITGGLPIASLLSIGMTVCFGYDMIKYKLFDIEAVTEESRAAVETIPRLDPGFSYMVMEQGTHYSYEIFRGMVSTTPGLCITSFYPQKFRNEYRLQKTPIIWLTETSTDERSLKPNRLDFEISYSITSFIKENEKTVILIDDLKYLAQVNGFERTLDFLKALNDIASINNATVLAPVNEQLFEEGEFKNLEGLFDKSISLMGETESKESPTTKPGYAYLFKEERPNKAYEAVSKIEPSRSIMCVSKTYPGKLKKLYNLERGKCYWLTSSSTEENALDPGRLQFEVEQTIMDYIKGNRNGALVLDGVDQLVMSTSFDLLTDFLKVIVDVASVNNVSLLVPVSPKAFEPVEMAVLEKRFDFIKDFGEEKEEGE